MVDYMKRRWDNIGKKLAFHATNEADFQNWKKTAEPRLKELIDYTTMQTAELDTQIGRTVDEGDYLCHHITIQPVIASQGAEDIVVSPMNQRLFRKIPEMHGNEIIYREIPGKPHAWVEPPTEDGGGEFFDHPEIYDFMMQRSLNPYPASVKIRLCDLSVNNTFTGSGFWSSTKYFQTPGSKPGLMGIPSESPVPM